MGEELRQIFKTATFRQSLITFSGTVLNGALGAIFYIMLARYLGPSGFGVLMIAITTLTLIAGISDIGTNTGLVRFVGKYAKSDPDKAKKILKLSLEVKLIVSVSVLLIGFLVSGFVAKNIFLKPEISTPLKLAFTGVGSALLFSYIVHTFQAYQKFYLWSGIQIGTNFLRILIILLFFRFGNLGIETSIITYISIPFLGFLLGLFLVPRDFMQIKKEFSVASEFFHYNKWVAAFSGISALSSRLDTLVTARLLTSYQVGLYSVANQLVQIVPQITVALGTVVAPKMASMSDIKGMVNYFKKVQFMVLLLAFLGVLSIPVVKFLIPFIYGADYTNSIPVFTILLFAMLVFLISVPVHNSVIYFFSYPKLFFFLSIGHLLITGVIGYIFILNMGVVGASIAVFIGSVFNFVVPLFWVVKKLWAYERKT